MKKNKSLQNNKVILDIRHFLIAAYCLITYFEPYMNGILGSIVKYYMFAVILCLLLLTRSIVIRNYHYPLLLWLGYKFLSVLWTKDTTVFQLHYASQLGIIALLLCITTVKHSEESLVWIRRSLWLGSAIIGVLSLFMSAPYDNVANRQVLTLFGQQNDPNNQAAFLLFGLAISMYYLLYQKKHRLVHLAVIFINAYATLMTGSRAGLLSIGMILLVYLLTLYNPKTLKTYYQRIAVVVLLIAAASIVLITFLPADITERLLNFTDYVGGSNRERLWSHGLQMLNDPITLLFGAGWGSYKADGGFTSLHNTFLSILCDTGILGFCLLFVPIGWILIKLLKAKHPLPISLFIAGIAPAFFIEAINKRFFWSAILYVYIAYNAYLKEKTPDDTPAETKRRCRYIK